LWAGRIFCFRGGPISCSLLTVLLLLVPIQKLQLDGAVRARVAVMTGLAVLGYFVLVYLIFFLVYTPIDTDHVRGVQGRYFVTALPVGAVFIAPLVNCELPLRSDCDCRLNNRRNHNCRGGTATALVK
jgi:uncharacterized membrane protein